MSQHMERIAAVCKWMWWKRVQRGNGECWERKVLAGKDRQVSVYNPVSTYDPWKYRDDLHDVLVHVLRVGCGEDICSRWANKKDLAGSMLQFSTLKPDEVMGEIWPYVERATCAGKKC